MEKEVEKPIDVDEREKHLFVEYEQGFENSDPTTFQHKIKSLKEKTHRVELYVRKAWEDADKTRNKMIDMYQQINDLGSIPGTGELKWICSQKYHSLKASFDKKWSCYGLYVTLRDELYCQQKALFRTQLKEYYLSSKQESKETPIVIVEDDWPTLTSGERSADDAKSAIDPDAMELLDFFLHVIQTRPVLRDALYEMFQFMTEKNGNLYTFNTFPIVDRIARWIGLDPTNM